MKTKKDLSILNNIEIAHRGLWNKNIPENSIGAFKRCIDKKIPIELDIHLLKDDTLVVFHDDNLNRLVGKNIILKNCCYDDIKDFKLKGTNFNIPTLDMVLNLVDGKVLLDIELKFDVHNFKICDEVCKYLDNYNGEFIIKSFNPFYIWWFKVNRPNIIRGLLVSKFKKTKMNNLYKRILFNMWFNFLAKPDFIAFDYKELPNKKIDKLKKKGIPILLFTVKHNKISKFKSKYAGFLYEE